MISERPAPAVGESAITRQKFLFYCGLLTVLALAFRLVLTVQFVGLDSTLGESLQPDQVDYELLAWRIANGQGMTLADGKPTACRSPGTSLALVPVYLVFGRSLAAGRIWFCVLSALTCAATAWTGRVMFDAATGLLAGLILAFYPNHAYYAMYFMSECPGGLFVILATGATIIAFRRNNGFHWVLLSGLFWGVAAIIRPNIILVLPLLGLLAVVPGLRSDNWIKTVRNLFVIGLATASILGPLVVRNRIVMGIFSISTVNAPTYWGAHNHRILTDDPGGWIAPSELTDEQYPLSEDEVERSQQMWKYSREFLSQNRNSLPYLTAMKFVKFFSPFFETNSKLRYWSFAVGWIISAILFIPGLMFAFRVDRTAAYIAVTPLLAILLTTFLYYGSTRFRDSLAPNYLLFSAAAVVYLIQLRKYKIESKTKI